MGWLFLRRLQRALRCPRGRSPRGPAFFRSVPTLFPPATRGPRDGEHTPPLKGVEPLLSDEHFDGTLIEAWAWQKSFTPKEADKDNNSSKFMARNARTTAMPRPAIPTPSSIGRRPAAGQVELHGSRVHGEPPWPGRRRHGHPGRRYSSTTRDRGLQTAPKASDDPPTSSIRTHKLQALGFFSKLLALCRGTAGTASQRSTAARLVCRSIRQRQCRWVNCSQWKMLPLSCFERTYFEHTKNHKRRTVQPRVVNSTYSRAARKKGGASLGYNCRLPVSHSTRERITQQAMSTHCRQ